MRAYRNTQFYEWVVNVEPTNLSLGIQTRTCIHCGLFEYEILEWNDEFCCEYYPDCYCTDEFVPPVTTPPSPIMLCLQIDVPLPSGMGTPMIVNSRTFLPIAYVAHALGARVRWDGDNRAVYIQR